MKLLWWKRNRSRPRMLTEVSIRARYHSFRELLTLNNDTLEIMAGLQEDLQYVPPHPEVIGQRVRAVFDKAGRTVAALGQLTGDRYVSLYKAVREQRDEVERFLATRQMTTPRVAAWLTEINADAASEVGGKAAALGEIKNKLGLPVPDGYVLTTEAYNRFCVLPNWREIRDAMRKADLSDLDGLARISAKLQASVMSWPIPRAIEIAVTERAGALKTGGLGLAVRSSGVGEGGRHTFAGQFLSLLNVPQDRLIEAYRRVIAGRFAMRALIYRLSTGLSEVDSPMAVLFLTMIPARASGVMYTRDPKRANSDVLWITATRGLALEIASGQVPADLFVVSRKRGHRIVERRLIQQEEEIIPKDGGDLTGRVLEGEAARAPSLTDSEIRMLTEWGLRIEAYFKGPQDIEFALDASGDAWILQARPLATAASAASRSRSRARGEPLLQGGYTVYPGRISGPVYLAPDQKTLHQTPRGAIIFVPRASPEIVQVFDRIAGLVAESGNVTGHSATLLREFKIPSIFQLGGAAGRLRNGEAVSLDAIQPAVYPGTLWPPPPATVSLVERYLRRSNDPLSDRLLTLHLLDPTAFRFRPSGCKSAHDVLRFCHEKAIEAVFNLNDAQLAAGAHRSKKLMAEIPVNLHVLDLGGGLALEDPDALEVHPSQIISRPFQALWRGVTHPGVSWQREMPASFGDLASVMAGALSSRSSVVRALGETSYLLVADQYMNLNSRLAYHFTLVDASVSETAAANYISFRFAGGGTTRYRRNLRACFIEACLTHYGFLVDRRGDLVNGWFKKAPAADTEERLDILGRLMACTSQLDMYMTSHEVMKWYVDQFLAGNYAFRETTQEPGSK